MSGLTDCPPAGGPPVLVQVVLKGVDLISLLDMVGQRIVVLHYPLTEEHPSFLILVISWSDSMICVACLVAVVPSLSLSTSRSNQVSTLTMSLPVMILQVWIMSPFHHLSSKVVRFSFTIHPKNHFEVSEPPKNEHRWGYTHSNLKFRRTDL